MSLRERISRLFGKRKPVVMFDWRNEPDCVDIPGVQCRWELPRPCVKPSAERCAGYGCDMQGGQVDACRALKDE